MVVIVATTIAMLIMIVVMMVLMVMIVATTIAMLIMIVVMMVLMVMIVMMVLMIVVMAAAGAVLIVIVVVMFMLMVMVLCCLHLRNDLGNGSAALHSFLQLRTGELAPGCGDDGSIGIMLPEHFHGSIQLLLWYRVCTGKNDAGCGLHLVVIELTKVLHVDLYLIGIYNSHGTAKLHIFTGDLFHSTDHIRQLTYAGGFNDDAVGVVFVDDLGQGTAEVAYQAAADAAGVHLGNVDACLLQKTAVNADLTKLVLDQH